MVCLWCCECHYNVYFGILSFCGILFADDVCHMSCDFVTLDLDGYNAIMSRRYLESWFNNSYCCILFTVYSVCKVIYHLFVFFSLSQTYHSENFFCISFPNMISVSSSLSHIIKLWVNLKSPILRWSAVIPTAIIGDLSAMFNLVVVGCIGVLNKTVIYQLICGVSDEGYGCSWIYKSLMVLSCMYCYCWTIHSATVTWLCVCSPPCVWESLLGKGSVNLNGHIPLLSHWSVHQNCNSLCVDLQFSPSGSSWDVVCLMIC